jgi:hypothetical protein
MTSPLLFSSLRILGWNDEIIDNLLVYDTGHKDNFTLEVVTSAFGSLVPFLMLFLRPKYVNPSDCSLRDVWLTNPKAFITIFMLFYRVAELKTCKKLMNKLGICFKMTVLINFSLKFKRLPEVLI